MRIRRLFVLCSVLTAASPALVCAQDTHTVGVTMGYPASFGVLWHASKKVAIRPEISFAGSSSESTTSIAGQTLPSINSEGDGWAIGTGVSALFYLRTYEHLRTYFSPRFTYAYTSNSTSSNLPSATGGTISGKQTGKGAAGIGSFGAQYMLGDRFSVFGEVGFGFSHTTSSSSATTATTGSTGSSNSWGTRAGVGVVFYP
jgi:hypothetical protein